MVMSFGKQPETYPKFQLWIINGFIFSNREVFFMTNSEQWNSPLSHEIWLVIKNYPCSLVESVWVVKDIFFLAK